MVSPKLSTPFRGKHEGEVLISGEKFELTGMIVGDVTVCNGGEFLCRGMVTGNVYVNDNATATIPGMVLGTISGTGNIQVTGMVKNHP